MEFMVKRYKCDECSRIFDSKERFDEHLGQHREEKKLVSIGQLVIVGISRGGQQQMGGPITFEGYDWATGRIVKTRKTNGELEALIERGDEREWVSAYLLREWKDTKAKEEWRAEHPTDYTKVTTIGVFSNK